MKIPLLARSQSSAFEKEDNKPTVVRSSDITSRSLTGSSAAKNFKPVTHVIFDVDGTLLDTIGIYGEVLSKVLKRHDKKLSWEFSVSTLGMRREETLAKIIDFYGLPYSPEELSQELFRLTLKKISKAFMMEGAERLVNHLHKHKVRWMTQHTHKAVFPNVRSTNIFECGSLEFLYAPKASILVHNPFRAGLRFCRPKDIFNFCRPK